MVRTSSSGHALQVAYVGRQPAGALGLGAIAAALTVVSVFVAVLLGLLVLGRIFRHKTTKEPFRTIFWCTVVSNCVALAAFVLDVPIAELWSE